jgi:hypothetical protein
MSGADSEMLLSHWLDKQTHRQTFSVWKTLSFRKGNYIATIPSYNIKSYFRSREDIDKDMQVAKAIAHNAIHQVLKDSWPRQVTLQSKQYLPEMENQSTDDLLIYSVLPLLNRIS